MLGRSQNFVLGSASRRGGTRGGNRERFLAAGFDGYLSKPLDLLELLAVGREHCS